MSSWELKTVILNSHHFVSALKWFPFIYILDVYDNKLRVSAVNLHHHVVMLFHRHHWSPSVSSHLSTQVHPYFAPAQFPWAKKKEQKTKKTSDDLPTSHRAAALWACFSTTPVLSPGLTLLLDCIRAKDVTQASILPTYTVIFFSLLLLFY